MKKLVLMFVAIAALSLSHLVVVTLSQFRTLTLQLIQL